MIEKKDTLKSKKWFGFIIGCTLCLIFGVALAIRIFPLQEVVFGSGWVNFQGVDSWYHIRLIENLLQHFPQRITFDPYTFYPYGQDVFFAPLFDWLIGFGAWIIGLGSPSQHTVEIVAAYFPPILGALVTLPVYFIGKALFNKKVGIISALIIAILPGHFLTVSRLGFVDHHVAEVLFSTIAILLLILALKLGKERSISFQNLKQKDWKILSRPLIFALLSGLALGIYLLTWVGGVMIVFLFFCWAVAMFVIHHIRNENSDYISILGILVFLVSFLLIWPFSEQLAYGGISLVALIVGVLSLPVLSIISRFIEAKNLKRGYYPLALVVLGLAGLGIFYVVDSSLIMSMLGKFQVFTPSTNSLTISEVQPLFLDQGHFSLNRIWALFTTASILAPVGFIFLVISAVRNRFTTEMGFFLIWCLVIFAATMGQVRFAAYLAICFALLSGYLLTQIIGWIPAVLKWFELKAPREETSKKIKIKKHKNQPATQYPIVYKSIYIALAVVLVFLLGVLPNFSPTKAVASADTGVSPELHDALIWMKDNTPEPFQYPNYFNSLYSQTTAKINYTNPESSYGIMNWWSYGHWITAIAQRAPISNPHQSGAVDAAKYFTAPDELTGNRIMDRLGAGYVLVDFDIAIPIDSNFIKRRFASIITWAGNPLEQYCEIYFQKNKNTLQPVILYYPAYYQCLSTRLYNFQGTQVVPDNSTVVISYTVDSGRKVIQSAQTFRNYAEGQVYLEKQTSPNFKLVGTSPFSSPIPLPKLEHYQEVYASKAVVASDDKSDVPLIRIFQYLP